LRKVGKKNNNLQRRKILDFARDNNLIIHPGRGFDYYVDGYNEFGHCPCDKNRLECPCPESVEEVNLNGWCKCRLFWRDYDTYKNSHVKE
jgi:hypothetical protein